MVAKFNLEFEQMDVKTYTVSWRKRSNMHQPEGFTVHDKKDHVCLLKKVLIWIETVIKAMVQMIWQLYDWSYDYVNCDYDACVDHKKLLDFSFIYLLLYVDVMLIATKNLLEINRLRSHLIGDFEMEGFESS